jgi:hypothetical protein
MYAEWRHSPKKIHEVFRTLSREQCEFIMSGVAPGEADAAIQFLLTGERPASAEVMPSA